MTVPQKPADARVSALPAPELVSLVEGSERPADGDWWAQYGGTLDPASGVIAFPPKSLPPCPFPCELCARRREGA
ncbi:hypothetical protein GCM10018980_58550 [Streptomyces capoamus]|uniref:Uncharacterized protein n=1 Tax=Streptomyces capoamus TaxID=68183 RepID=A0A919F0R1_9ACTN|nr:hypothetical protein GCM10010501_48250 [Streptomyces libani subsp. rufus]GHG66270.1 hypothetical protein GCM10018980_58550 [Streptomyces capoamus]